MEHSNERSIDEHVKFTESMVKRLESLYQQICEYEQMSNEDTGPDETQNLLHLVQSIQEIHLTAKVIGSATTTIESNTRTLEQQIQLVERSFDLLQLEHSEQQNHSEMD